MTDILLGSLPDWINKWGPLLLIILTMLYIGYRLALKIFTGVGMKIVEALDKPSAALTLQANALNKLTGSIQDYVHRDSNEHQEIIILQKVIREEIKGIRNQSTCIEKKLQEMHDGRSKN
jgi:hypothetical protein